MKFFVLTREIFRSKTPRWAAPIPAALGCAAPSHRLHRRRGLVAARLHLLAGLAAIVPMGSHAKAASFIIGGQQVKPTDPIAKSTVGIFRPGASAGSGSLCTATLLRKNIALTAAHCVTGRGGRPQVLFGPDLHSPNTQREPVDAVAINPNWGTKPGRASDQGDVALVRINGTAPRGYKPATIASSAKDLRAGEEVQLAGYGINNARAKSGAGKLRQTSSSILNPASGHTEMIIDQSEGRGVCHGDSGGPAFIKRSGRWRLAGVTNRSYPPYAPDDCGHQAVFTKVPAVKKWISTASRKLEQGDGQPPLMNPSSAQIPLLRHRVKHRHFSLAKAKPRQPHTQSRAHKRS